jgi:hypothetical protein
MRAAEWILGLWIDFMCLRAYLRTTVEPLKKLVEETNCKWLKLHQRTPCFVIMWLDGRKRQPKHVAVLSDEIRCALTRVEFIRDWLYIMHAGMSQLNKVWPMTYVKNHFVPGTEDSWHVIQSLTPLITWSCERLTSAYIADLFEYSIDSVIYQTKTWFSRVINQVWK